jgi:hypothetical protein
MRELKGGVGGGDELVLCGARRLLLDVGLLLQMSSPSSILWGFATSLDNDEALKMNGGGVNRGGGGGGGGGGDVWCWFSTCSLLSLDIMSRLLN